MAAYSASKAALSAWLTALRHERGRRGVTISDIRPQHMNTGLVDRAITGAPPRMPPAVDPDDIVARVLDGLRHDARELHYNLTGDGAAPHNTPFGADVCGLRGSCGLGVSFVLVTDLDETRRTCTAGHHGAWVTTGSRS